MKPNILSRFLISRLRPWFRVLLSLALAAASPELAYSADAEDLSQYGRKWEEIKTNWGSELDRHNKAMEDLNKMPPGPERDGLINKEMAGHRAASQDMARQRQDIHDKVIQEVNRRTGGGQQAPDGRNVPEARQTEGTKVTDPKHRGMPGDTDAGGTSFQADKVKKVLDDMGIKAPIKTTPSTVEVGDDFNFTVNKEGKLGRPGSGAHQTQVHVDARNKETYVSEGMNKTQAGRDHVQVQDHMKKAMGGLKSSPEDLARNPDTARDMVKGTSKTMDHLSDAEIREIMKKNNISGTPQDFRDRMKAIKEGRAPVTPENAAQLQQASRDVFDKAGQKTKAKADHEVAATREKIEQLEKAGAKQEAQKLREELVDSMEKIRETGAANREALNKGQSGPAKKGAKTTPEPTAKGGPTQTEPSGKTTTAETPRETAGAAGKSAPDQTAKGGKTAGETPSAGKTAAGEPASGRTAGKPETTAKAPADPSPGGKTSSVEPSGTKGGGRPASEPIVEPAGKGAKTTPEPTGKGGTGLAEPSGKTPTAETPRDTAGAAGKSAPDQTAKGGKPTGETPSTGKTSAPEPASAGKAAAPEPTGTKGGQPTSERITEPSIKDGAPSARTTAEPTGKPAGQTAEAPKGKGPAIDAPDAHKGRAADAPDAKPRAPGAPEAPKMGALRKGVNIAGEAMNAAGTLADAEDFKEAAKKGDAEGMLRTGARGVAGLTPLGSAALGAKDTYDMVKERRGDKAEAEKATAEANKRHEETYDLQSALALRRAGMSRDEVKELMAAKARGDETPLNSKFKELGIKPPEREREQGPKADDTAWDRTKDVAAGMATQVQKAGKFAKETAKDLTEIGTGMLDKGTRDEVIDQVKENVSIDNLRAGLEARKINQKADADRAAARDKLEDKLVEKGASRDEARNAADAWDQGDRGALDQLKDKLGLSGAKTGQSRPETPETAQGGKNGDRLSDLRSSETRTDQTDKEKRKDSPTDPRDGTKLAQNTNTADTYSKDRTSKSSEDAQQARGDAGSTLTERIGADQARSDREKAKIESQGQETNRTIAGAQREHAGAERGKQADRQNSIGNVIAEGAAGGLTSGVATGLDKLGSTVGAAAGDKASSRMGIKPKTLTQTQSPSGGADPGSTSGGSASREQTSPQTPAGGSAAGGTANAGTSAPSGGQAPAASGTATATSATSGPKPASSSGSQRTPASSSAPPTGTPCKNQKPGGSDWVCAKQVVCYSDRTQTVMDCAEWTNSRTGARTKPSTTSSPTTTAAATPPPSSTGTQSLWDCICRCNSSARSSVSVSYDLKPRNTSPSCANPSNGQCVNQGFGCWRHKFDSSSACAKSCYKFNNVAESARP